MDLANKNDIATTKGKRIRKNILKNLYMNFKLKEYFYTSLNCLNARKTNRCPYETVAKCF